MVRRIAWAFAIGACAGAPGAIAPIPIAAPAPSSPGLVVSDAGLGPVVPTTRANLIALRAVLPDFDVRPINVDKHVLEVKPARLDDDDDPLLDDDLLGGVRPRAPTLEYQVFDPATGAKLFAIAPDLGGAIASIEISSSKVTVAGHAWRAGEKLGDASALAWCRCLDGHPMCFARGARVAVTFERSCRGAISLDARTRHRLEDLVVKHVVWTPTPRAAGGSDPEETDDDPCGP